MLEEFIKKHDFQLIQSCIQFRTEYGLGILFVFLHESKNDQAPMSYILYNNLNNEMQNILKNNKKIKQTIYYMIVFGNDSKLIERILD